MTDPGDAFMTDPGAWADPAAAAAYFAPGLAAPTVRRLLGSPRLGARASTHLAACLGYSDGTALPPGELSLARAAPSVLRSVALGAGAVWHARRVRALVLGADITRLSDQIGEATRDLALRHVDLAPDPAVAESPDPATLADDIVRDGGACLGAWIAALPDWAAARVRLKWRDDGPPRPAGLDHDAAVRIVRVLAAELYGS